MVIAPVPVNAIDVNANEITLYGQLLHDYLAWVRRSSADPTFYEDFDLLRSRIAALRKKRSVNGYETGACSASGILCTCVHAKA